MNATKLHWIHGPWKGKLALASRPRGNEWISDEISAWRKSGVDTVVSLLTPSEEEELSLTEEGKTARSLGLSFLSFPIADRDVPSSEQNFADFMENLERRLSKGKNLVVHCRQGIGRSGLVGACLLITKGWSSEAAILELSNDRGVPVPETSEQRNWIERFAHTMSQST